MNKQQAMQALFGYLVSTSDGTPGVRNITVSGESEGRWSVKFAVEGVAGVEHAEGFGADFAEALDYAMEDWTRINTERARAGLPVWHPESKAA
jgi:hypothetical protein